MLSYCVSLLHTSGYELVDFIRNSSHAGILVTVGLLFFVFGTLLRRHLPRADRTENSHTPVLCEPAISSKLYRKAPEGAPAAYSAAAQNHGSHEFVM